MVSEKKLINKLVRLDINLHQEIYRFISVWYQIYITDNNHLQ